MMIYMVDYEMDEVYQLELSESVIPDYKYTYQLTSWLKSNLESLTDDDDNQIFAKVNIGFGEDNVKSFGNRGTCDVHINTINFEDDFESSRIDIINSIIVFKVKGNQESAMIESTKILDYLIQEFITNDSFKTLSGYVKDTRLTNAGLREQPNKSNWYVLGVLELQHLIF